MRISARGQSLLEYTILVVVIIAALISMNTYLKRGIQGRWKDSVDGLGDQYDPEKTNSVVTHRIESNSESRVQTIRGGNQGVAGYYTMRSDVASSRETKNGGVQIGHY
ncbi:MAG: hypothetical protein HQL20_01310 [Candidatus Omnitrophica bacterium]|nr:hypothetical protein [Candidatus Omnitrophota bacterium]